MKKLTGFAEACYNDNSIFELMKPHAPINADATDCREWDITAEQWTEAIDQALAAKQFDILVNA